MPTFWKKISLKKSIAGILTAVTLLVFITWISLPYLAKWGLAGLARDHGYSDFNLKVEQVDPWSTRFSKLGMANEEGMKVALERLNLVYSPNSLALGKIDAISMTGLDVEVSAESFFTPPPEAKDDRKGTLEDNLRVFIDDPFLNYFRIRDSKVTVVKDGEGYPSVFELKGDFYPGLARLILDGSILGTSFLSKFDLERDEGGTYATGSVRFPDLSQLESQIAASQFLSPLFPDGVSLSNGEIGLNGSGKVEADLLTELFVELNASNLGLEVFEQKIELSKFFLFLTPESQEMKVWQANAYANISVDELLSVKGARVSVKAEGPAYEANGEINQLKTIGDFPLLEVKGLSLPIFDLDILPGSTDEKAIPSSSFWAGLVGKEKKFFYDKVSYENDLLFLSDGSLSVLFPQPGSQVLLNIPPSDATFGDIAFVDFSYAGLIDWEEFPRISQPQVVSGKRILIGLESVLENLAITFRLENLETIMVDLLAFEAGGTVVDFNPANFRLQIPPAQPGSLVLTLEGSSVRLPEQEIIVEGMRGEIVIDSLEPLSTGGTQTVSFDRIIVSELEIGEGNFSFVVEPSGTIRIESVRARLWGGEVGLRESSFGLYEDDFRVNTRVTGIDAQQVADLLAGQDLRIDGNFSGDVTFSNEDGKWDFSNGLVLLDPSPNAKLNYKADDVLLKGLKKSSKEYKKIKMTNDAMENLSLESMRILFKALDGNREVVLSIRGKADTGKSIIHLDNNMNFIAGIRELAGAYFDFGKLGIDLGNFGGGLNNLEID